MYISKLEGVKRLQLKDKELCRIPYELFCGFCPDSLHSDLKNDLGSKDRVSNDRMIKRPKTQKSEGLKKKERTNLSNLIQTGVFQKYTRQP